MDRSFHRAALSIPLLVALSFQVQFACAQKPLAHDFLMRVEGMTGRDQEKIVFAAINDQDPSALVSIDVPGQQVKIRTIIILDRPALETVLGTHGVSIISLASIVMEHATLRVSPSGDLPGFPLFVDTGDPAHDEQVYQTNKAFWIAAHPDHYPPTSETTVPDQR